MRRTPALAGYKSDAAAVGATAVSAVIGFVTLAVAMVIFSGFVLSQLWAWFVVSSLNAPELGIGESLGIATVVSFFLNQHGTSDNKVVLLAPLVSLLWGATLHFIFGVGG